MCWSGERVWKGLILFVLNLQSACPELLFSLLNVSFQLALWNGLQTFRTMGGHVKKRWMLKELLLLRTSRSNTVDTASPQAAMLCLHCFDGGSKPLHVQKINLIHLVVFCPRLSRRILRRDLNPQTNAEPTAPTFYFCKPSVFTASNQSRFSNVHGLDMSPVHWTYFPFALISDWNLD